jgi:hypothetical protein
LSQDKIRQICYSLAQLYVKYVYLNVFGWRWVMKHLRGVQALKVWEPLSYTVYVYSCQTTLFTKYTLHVWGYNERYYQPFT